MKRKNGFCRRAENMTLWLNCEVVIVYLSRVMLDQNKRDTIKALASPSIFHGAVEASFKGPRDRRLWRIDTLRGKSCVLILSEEVPELDGFAAQFGYDREYETKEYGKLLERIEEGSVWQFRLTANPTYSSTNGDIKRRGKVKAHRTETHQREWLIKKAEHNGFFVNDDDFSVSESKFLKFRKRNGDTSSLISIISVTYEGVLRVTDKEKFKNALCCGIGREKAYGMGLMTVMRIGNG